MEAGQVSAESEQGRVAVITGAGSGVGRAVARELIRRSWRVALAGRRREPLEETAAGASALVVPTDVTDAPAVERLFDQVLERFGRVDLLFNNAGLFGPIARVDELSLEDWRALVDTNLTGSFLCARRAFGAMASQDPRGGRIINNGSISAHVPRPHQAAYTTTKHAITGLTRQIALDGRELGIACGQIDIGNAETELTSGIAKGALQADGSRRPEPMMDVENAAQAVVYMAGLPLEANVLFMTVMASAMPYVGRG